jgi:hypothetical protein
MIDKGQLEFIERDAVTHDVRAQAVIYKLVAEVRRLNNELALERIQGHDRAVDGSHQGGVPWLK